MNINQINTLKDLSKAFLESLESNDYQEKTKKLENIESFLEHCIQENPKDNEAYLRLAITVNTWPLRDSQKAISTIQKALFKNPYNIDALLMLTYFYDSNFGFVDENIWNKIRNIQTNNPIQQANIEQAKSWYYRGKYSSIQDSYANQYIQYLEKAIKLDSKTVTPYIRIGQFYLEGNDIIKGKEFIRKGLGNVVYVGLWRMQSNDLTSIKDFFDINYRGIYITPDYYEIIKEMLI